MILSPPPSRDKDLTSRDWQKWFSIIPTILNDVVASAAASVSWSGIGKTGSNITDIETRNHDDLQNFDTGNRRHLSSEKYADLTDGGTTTLHQHDFDHITFPTQWSLGTFTHVYTLQELMNHEWSAGVVDGCDITDNGDGTISLAAGVAVIRGQADGHTTLYGVITTAQANIALTDNATNYVYLDYNAGVPQFSVSTSITSFNCMDKCIAYMVHRSGNALHYVDAREQNVDSNRKMRQMFLKYARFIHAEGGSVLGSNGLAINVTAGSFYFMLAEQTHIAFDTSVAGTANANVFTLWTVAAGVWTETTNSKLVSTTTYNDTTTGVVTLGNNKFGVTWFYIINDAPSELHGVMGQAQYANIAEARVASPPTNIPSIVSGIGVLIGFVVYEKSNTVFDNVYSSFSTSFTPGLATIHNGLSGLQGGAVNEYYHLTSTQHTNAGTFLTTPSSANLASMVTDETGSGALVFATSPTLVTPALGTPASGTLDNCTTNTEAAGTNNTQLANTAHVYAERTNTATLTNKTLTSGLVTATLSDNTATLGIADAKFVKAQIAADCNAHQHAQAVNLTYAASGSTGITVADNANIDFGTGDFTLVWDGALPDWTPSAAKYLHFKSSAGIGFSGYVDTTGKIGFVMNSVGYLSTEAAILVDNTHHNVIISIIRETAATAGSITFYIDGVQLGSSVSITSGSPASVNNAISLYVSGSTVERTASINKSTLAYNRALSAAEVLSLYRNGINFADKWGNQTGQTSGTLTIYKRYRITTFVAGDSFTNVGASSNATGVEFVATGTTPTTWANGSTLNAIGATLALEPEGIQPNQWHDSANNLHAGYPTGGSSLTRWKEAGLYEWTTAITADTTLTSIVPAGYELEKISFKNSTTNAVSVRLGTTAGGADIFGLTALNISTTLGGYKTVLCNQGFSTTTAQTLYLSSTSWSSASLTFTMYFRRIS